MFRTALVLAFLSTPAVAMVTCPSMEEGHPLSRSDGASLYLGDPMRQMLLAPTRQARTMRENNVWLFSGEAVTLVCKYDGTRRALARSMPVTVRSCVQNLAANTMVCQ